ncbi:hypothetical protein ACLB2K_020924 [Fragaria x ananassa]
MATYRAQWPPTAPNGHLPRPMATYRALLSLKSSLDDPDSRLSALRLLNVFNNTFPPELSNLTNLRVLDLYNNNLTGVLPVSVATFHCDLIDMLPKIKA